MKGILRRLLGYRGRLGVDGGVATGEEHLRRRVKALFAVLGELYGADHIVLQAGRLEALPLLRSRRLPERVLALQRLVFDDPTIGQAPKPAEIPAALDAIEEEIAEGLARQKVEEALDERVARRVQERHEEYLKEVRLQILKEETGPDNAQTLRKYAELEKLETRRLSRSSLEALRPASFEEVVGQERAIRALFAKIASPFPQHVILYGPPGVGKTTVARLALEAAKRLAYTPFAQDARFVEVDGSTLRWDPREVANPLLGSVHDPIYQGARRDLADAAIPEPKPGLVTEAHGGVLFIDEIGEMDPFLQSKLLKVLEDKRVLFDSAYYDPADPNVPKYIKKLFDEGAPADFLLIGATTRDPSEINPALRSRCGAVFFDPLGREEISEIVRRAATKLGVRLEPGVPALISEYTIEGRQAAGIFADAYGLALHRHQDGVGQRAIALTVVDVEEVVRVARIIPHVVTKAEAVAQVGRVLGLGVAGFVGSVLEIEAVAFPAAEPGKGALRFNQAAGSMARDSVFNAASVVRRLTRQNLADFDVHVNVVGGGKIDGPSAGAAVVLAVVSALRQIPLRQDVAITGEISLQGKVKGVGGVHEKLYGARQAGITRVLVPAANIAQLPSAVPGVEVMPIADIEEALIQLAANPGEAKAQEGPTCRGKSQSAPKPSSSRGRAASAP